ncbi:MAG: YidC/Oxa1 family membrane protein insertase [Candidatus Nanoperiomorbaceae bacterium]
MNVFDLILTQPIFNLLAFIYAFVGDFGIAIIILTIIVRLILWPLVKKQLHQTKVMRQIQPELRRIKKRANGDRMLESQLMMELYREKGVKPMSSILVLVIQIPIFIALYSVIRILSVKIAGVNPEHYLYPFMQNFHVFASVHNLIIDPNTHTLFHFIDLTKTAANYAPALILGIVAAVFQFWQSKQVMPQSGNQRKLRDIFKAAGRGEEVDQSEMMAATTGKMIYIFPLMTFFIALALPAALVLYYAVTSIVAVIQQGLILRRNEDEMLKDADQTSIKSQNQSRREQNAKPAEIIRKPTKSSYKASTNKPQNNTTVVRRIKAK